ncbi:MAG: hypothetical protein HeimC3_16690 [Candidatus Heimdallarchaeota archaeon LC_3]|nr:MAG: hypothetical protein HeimC3_16690 [Candidatus Heimdallarchaeota archaeon LC_3]
MEEDLELKGLNESRIISRLEELITLIKVILFVNILILATLVITAIF